MKSRKIVLLILLLMAFAYLAVGCGGSETPPPTNTPEPTMAPTPTTPPQPDVEPTEAAMPTTPPQADANMGQQHGQEHGQGHGQGKQGMGGPGEGMRERHQAPIPAEYQGLTNPVPADEASLARGEQIYAEQCATCHGDGGMGDGPAGEALDPAPAPIAHSSQMLSDSYLFWRINEGGAQFGTAMLPYKDTLSEQEIWDVINYIRALGSGDVQPRQNVGGQAMDPAAEAQKHAEMLATGVEQGIITQEEADIFTEVHDKLNQYKETHMDEIRSFMGNPEEMQQFMLDAMVKAGEITQEQADAFVDIHDRLVEAGIMQ